MSIGQFILAGNWLLEGRYFEKWDQFKKNPLFQLLLSFLPILLISLLWSNDLSYGIKDARIKFPLFLMPFVIGSSKAIKKSEWKVILAVYLLTLLLLFLASLGKFFGLLGINEVSDKRELSIFISHIRYGLNLLLGGLLAIYFSKLYGDKFKFILIALSFVFFSSLLLLELYTALGIGLTISGLYVFHKLLKTKRIGLKVLGIAGSLAFLLIGILSILKIYQDYHQLPEMSYDQNQLARKSELGNHYWHDLNDRRTENGVYIMRFVQEKELKEAWNQRSAIDFDSVGTKGNAIYQTLVRFLSSKGLTKDAKGLNSLNEQEIRAIENGIPNAYYLEHFALQNRVFTTIYELDNYQKFGYAEGFSLGMRLEYWKTAWKIIKKNFWVGVGSGDVQLAFDLQYEIDDSSLSMKNRRRAHNQFLTIWISLGIMGLIYFLVYLFYPLTKAHNEFYPIFFCIAFLSFFTEDTLETQAGVTFFAFFNSLFLLGIGQFRTSK